MTTNCINDYRDEYSDEFPNSSPGDTYTNHSRDTDGETLDDLQKL